MPAALSLTSALYFHGLPGSAAELQLADLRCKAMPEVAAPLDAAAFHRAAALTAGCGLRLVGFSLGSHSALRFAARWPEKVQELVLISPAAPLDLGDFIEHMAGAPVFRLARKSSLGFRVLTAAQGLAVRASPRTVLNRMFVGTAESERSLLADPVVQGVLIQGLQQSFGPSASRYRRAVEAYVHPWSDLLPAVRCPVRIYQGESDTWTPPAMAQALAAALPGPVTLTSRPGLGHYGALIDSMPAAFADETPVLSTD